MGKLFLLHLNLNLVTGQTAYTDLFRRPVQKLHSIMYTHTQIYMINLHIILVQV